MKRWSMVLAFGVLLLGAIVSVIAYRYVELIGPTSTRLTDETGTIIVMDPSMMMSYGSIRPASTRTTDETVAIIVMDTSTMMSYGSKFTRPGNSAGDFRYEPWSTVLEMLDEFYELTDICTGFVGLVDGPSSREKNIYLEPCLDEVGLLSEMDRQWPGGWYDFEDSMWDALFLASEAVDDGAHTELVIINRGPVMPCHIDLVPQFIDYARGFGIQINVVPMGNEPRWRFPNLQALRRLARETGGDVFYPDPPPTDIYDFSYLLEYPSMLVEVLDD